MLSSVSSFTRKFNILEFQSKEICAKFNVSAGTNVVAKNPEEAEAAFRKIGLPACVVKAQVYAGGRGKGEWVEDGFKSGVHFVKSPQEAREVTAHMIGRHLRTKQTGQEGALCNCVMLSDPVEIARELYFAIVLDRTAQAPVVIASTQGGVEIEEVAHKTPEAIFKVVLDGIQGITEPVAKNLCTKLGLKGKAFESGVVEMQKLWKLFVGSDATQVEVNPLAETTDGRIITVDSKFNFDDSAHYRQKQIFGYRDLSAVNPLELRAEESGLNYVPLDGDIACLVNGAGLAMATMDVIKLAGGDPANFLDLGGAASEKTVTEGFEIITANPKVKAILVNIFGGIVKCDIIAKGVIGAIKKVGLKIPLVVRLEGTNVDLGKKIFKESGLPIISASNLREAGEKAVLAAKGH
ncbi:Succinyl-CoA ligase [GDP-forming] subunit beta, hydrogenosomal [Tritrichomonas foetus]|uniref:Succinate--CoA ligase [ADP-forming] subunit beta, mitochondrial n=1 Tax=Tritrichomonas foetus TaxID=1144522 RepID=A0A1J4K4R3_9EUKA|nr:succinyl-CoA ligase subunit beta, hydrogenosomal [Tritrichomonas foetus]OHT06187.1 Succinyl-CoA ligase [GDP-forming] subunit beta, hydrogenosomal [Tritrichomonas foetus]|eukprot:OHT06187.1 Succinyl-CoA ligase [GDP-forming] subunit beta, hydrogenosomal [Tritrichomonas foetus]